MRKQFNQIWRYYPNKTRKEEAEAEYVAALKSHDSIELLKATFQLLEYCSEHGIPSEKAPTGKEFYKALRIYREERGELPPFLESVFAWAWQNRHMLATEWGSTKKAFTESAGQA